MVQAKGDHSWGRGIGGTGGGGKQLDSASVPEIKAQVDEGADVDVGDNRVNTVTILLLRNRGRSKGLFLAVVSASNADGLLTSLLSPCHLSAMTCLTILICLATKGKMVLGLDDIASNVRIWPEPQRRV